MGVDRRTLNLIAAVLSLVGSLAAVIDVLNATRARTVPDLPTQVSSRLLYEMARLTDEWAGMAVSGPKAREALELAFPDADVSNEALPYMGCRDFVFAIEPLDLVVHPVEIVGALGARGAIDRRRDEKRREQKKNHCGRGPQSHAAPTVVCTHVRLRGGSFPATETYAAFA